MGVPRAGGAAVALLLSLGETGCFDTTVREPPRAVFALFDPSMPVSSSGSPRVPLPSDLSRTTSPPGQPVLAPMSGPLDPSTLAPSSVVAIDLTAMAPIAGVPARFDETQSGLLVGPPAAGWPVGHRIAVALRGGGPAVGGLGGVEGEPVVASPAFYFVRGESPLATCTTASAACRSTTPVLSDEQARALEPLRLALAPLVAQLSALGLPREQLALAWTFTVVPPPGSAAQAGGTQDGGP